MENWGSTSYKWSYNPIYIWYRSTLYQPYQEVYLPSTPWFFRQVSLLRSKAVIRCTKEAPAAESFAEEVEDCGFEAKVISDSWPRSFPLNWFIYPAPTQDPSQEYYMFRFGNPYEPSFPTVTGWGVVPI